MSKTANLGPCTAYGIAKKYGYAGSEEEWNALQNKLKDEAKTYATNAKASESNAKTSETNAKASETAVKTSEQNVVSRAEEVKTTANNISELLDVVMMKLANVVFSVDFETGNLVYEDTGAYQFTINTDTGNLEMEVI